MVHPLLISGSRGASPDMLRRAELGVLRAKQLGWSITVGDASGVDAVVIQTCNLNDVPYLCYGISRDPRCTIAKRSAYTRVRGNYLDRDRYMVHLADEVYCIWNGVSRGTKYTYDCAIGM